MKLNQTKSDNHVPNIASKFKQTALDKKSNSVEFPQKDLRNGLTSSELNDDAATDLIGKDEEVVRNERTKHQTVIASKKIENPAPKIGSSNAILETGKNDNYNTELPFYQDGNIDEFETESASGKKVSNGNPIKYLPEFHIRIQDSLKNSSKHSEKPLDRVDTESNRPLRAEILHVTENLGTTEQKEMPTERYTDRSSVRRGSHVPIPEFDRMSKSKKFFYVLGANIWKGIVVIFFHGVVMFTSYSYKSKYAQLFLNFPILGVLLALVQINILHYLTERDLHNQLSKVNKTLVEKININKFSIIPFGAKILLIVFTASFQLMAGLLIYFKVIHFNQIYIMVSLIINTFTNFLVWYTVYLRKDESSSQSEKVHHHQYMLKKELENIKKIHTNLIDDMRETKRILELNDINKLNTLGSGDKNIHLTVESMQTVEPRIKKVNLTKALEEAQVKAINSFLLSFIALIQFLIQTAFILIYRDLNQIGIFVALVTVAYLIIADISPIIYFRLGKNKSNAVGIISTSVSAVVFRFIFLELKDIDIIYVVVLLKLVYRLARIFGRTIYYLCFRKYLLAKRIKELTAENHNIYTPDLFEEEYSKIFISIKKFSSTQYIETLSNFIFLIFIAANRGGFNGLELTLAFRDNSPEFADTFYYLVIIEFFVDILFMFVQFILIKYMPLPDGYNRAKLIKELWRGGKNYRFILALNLFCFFALYFYYSNRNLVF